MDQNSILIGVVAAIVGLVIGHLIAKQQEKNNASELTRNAKRTANEILNKAKSEAESLKKDKIFQAKERFLELKAEHEKVILSRDKKMAEAEKRTRDKESQVSS